MALVRPTSPLRVQPAIDDREAASLDAIAFAANVVDVVYGRLTNALAARPVQVEAVFADAWSMIDWIHRLDGLVRSCRGLSKKAEAVIDFLNGSSLVESHRHAIQHPEGTLPATAQSGRSPWGHLCWTIAGPEGVGVGYTMVIATPSIRKLDQAHPYRYPDARDPRSPVDWVSLYPADGEAEISLTGQHEALVRFVVRLEAAVAASDPPPAGGILKILSWPR